MAQEKLLFYVMLLLLCSGTVIAEADNTGKIVERENASFNFKAQDLERAQALTAKARQMTYQEVKTKWLELQNMLGNNEGIGEGNEGRNSNNKPNNNLNNPGNSLNDESSTATFPSREWGSGFRIFVSSSMSKNLLQAYASAAKEYGAVLVFNGLPNGSWRELSKLVAEISGDNPEYVAMQVDDEAFTKFGVTEVPSFVLSKEEDMFAVNPSVTFDKVSGSIGIRSALEMFASSGQLKDLANSKLKSGRVER